MGGLHRLLPTLMAGLLLLAACRSGAAPSPAPADGGTAPAAPAAAAAQAPSAAPEPTKLSIPYTPVSGVTAPLWIAIDNGLFAQQGLDVDAEFFSGGSVPIIQAMVAGQYPIGMPGGGDVILNRLGGGDLSIVGIHQGFFTIEAYASPDIHSIADLKGRRIAVTRVGTSTYFAGVAALASAGLKPDDVAFVQSGGVPESATVLMAGQADAAMMGYPAAMRVEQAGFPRLFSFADLGDYGLYPTAVIATPDSWLREGGNRDVALRFLRAVTAGLQIARDDPATFKRVVGKYTNTDDEAILQGTYDNLRPYFPQTLRAGEQAIHNALQLIDHPAAKDADPKQFYDNSLVDEISR